MDKKDPIWITFGIYSAIGFQFAIAVLAGLFLGNYLDEKWGSAPFLTLTGLIFGFSGGLYNLIKVLNWKRDR